VRSQTKANTPSLHTGSDTNGSMVSITSRANDTNVYVIPSEFYKKVGDVPRSEGNRITQFRQQCKAVETCVGRGDGEVYTVAMARMHQLENELDGVIDSFSGDGLDFRAPQTKKAAKAANKEDKNRSALHHSNKHTMSKQSKGNKRRKQQIQSQPSGCHYCKQIDNYKTSRNIAGYVPVRIDHSERDCPRFAEYGQMMKVLDASRLKSEPGGDVSML